MGLIAVGVLAAATIGRGQSARPRADVTPVVESDAVHAGATLRAALLVTLPEGFHVQSDKPRDASFIPTVLSVEPPAGITVTEIVYPAPVDLKQVGLEQPLAVFERDFAVGVRMAVARDVPEGSLTVPARLRYQACDATTCYVPTTADVEWTVRVVPARARVVATRPEVFKSIAFGRGEAPRRALAAQPKTTPAALETRAAQLDDFVVLGATGGYLGSEEFLRFIHNAETGVKERGFFEGRGPLAILLIVFAGGLALNLTPCVLPMIPINLAIIGAGAKTGSRRRGFLLGAAYGGAMAVVYGVLGLVVILTAGTFGTINASPWFNLTIALLFVMLALAMFDVVTLDFSGLANRFSPGSRESTNGSLLVAFGMGAIAALLAGACVAPVVIQVVLFASNLYATGTAIALGLPFFLGAGMALPWPIAGAGLAALPQPGPWMVRVKQFLGVLILATAAYYGYEAYSLFASRSVDPGAVVASVQDKVKSGWHASLTEGLETARREQRPVLIDLWATWCKNCLVMDKTTLEDPAVALALSSYVKIKFQAEQPDEAPTRAVMERFKAVGLPTYVILRPH